MLSIFSNVRFNPQRRTPYESVMNYTPYILEYVLFGWFQWCWYFDEDSCSKRLCHWIRPDHQVRKYFCSYLILDNGEYISRSLVIPIPKSNFNSFDMKERMQTFMKSLEFMIGDYWQPLYDSTNPNEIYYSFLNDDIEDDNADLPYGYELIDVKV